MKTNYSFVPLDESFQKLKISNIQNDSGSITPKTAKTRSVLDKIELSENAINFSSVYKNNIQIKLKENLIKSEDSLKQSQKKLDLLDNLINLEDPKSECYKTYTKNLNTVKSEITSVKERVNLIYNSKSITTPIEIKEVKGFGFETIYQEDIKDADSLNINTPAVLRYGLNSESYALKDLVGNYIEKGVLHPYEEALFAEAFNYLDKVESGEKYIQDKFQYPNNIVLIDIFDRSSDIINDGNNQTHTIALWKKKDDELVLIDPSQKSYSEHLLAPIKSNFGKNINTLVCTTLYGVAVYKPNDKTEYSSYLEQKPKPRDCVDIAVKIAFELNEQQKNSPNLLNIENNMLAQISNDSKNAEHLTKFKNVVIRELQSSSSETRLISQKTLNSLHNSLIDDIVQRLKIRTDKIENYQDIQKLEPTLSALTTMKKYI